MDRKFFTTVITILVWCGVVFSENNLTTDEIIHRIVEKAKQNEELANEIGFHQVTSNRKLSDGKVSSQKIRLHRLTWIENQPYLELLKVDGREPEAKEKKEEAERRAKFVKSLHEKKKDDDEDEDDVTWEEMYAKYDFQQLPSDSIGRYVFSFKPKPGRLSERSRSEKILNHLNGKFWADEEFHIVRAEARLMDNVKFGLGILGKIEKLEIKYEQQHYESVRVPSYFYVHFKARLAMLKTEERKIETVYSDFFHRDSIPSK